MKDNIITKFLFSLQAEGLMEDYSDKHFLIRAMNGDPDIISKYTDFIGDTSTTGLNPDFSSSFLMNISSKLQKFSKIIPGSGFKKFVQDRLSAGKDKYEEHTFFEVLSEINVLNYVGTFAGVYKEIKYEPPLRGEANPEVRFILEDNTIIDVEVKMGNFTKPLEIGKAGTIKPNIPITDKEKHDFKQFCQENDLAMMFPRILKVGDFIRSAASKFETPTSNKHFNVLFINWTYTDIPKCGLNEPLSIFINTKNGIFVNDEGITSCKIKADERNSVSAVVLYRDSFDSLLSGDFRYHFCGPTFRYLVNDLYNQGLEYKHLSNALHMNPYNISELVDWFPYDYVFTPEAPPDLNEKCRDFFTPRLVPGPYFIKNC